MSDRKERRELDDVLDDLVASGTEPNSPSFIEWIQRYPQYKTELIEFAASWSLMTWLPQPSDVKEIDEETLVLRGMSTVQNLLHRQEAASAIDCHTTPISSLLKRAAPVASHLNNSLKPLVSEMPYYASLTAVWFSSPRFRPGDRSARRGPSAGCRQHYVLPAAKPNVCRISPYRADRLLS